MHTHVPDPALTAHGREQASAWRSVTAKWRAAAAAAAEGGGGKGERKMCVLVSPLLRAVQTAALAFTVIGVDGDKDDGTAGGAVDFAAAPEARELWWASAQNRGRALGSLAPQGGGGGLGKGGESSDPEGGRQEHSKKEKKAATKRTVATQQPAGSLAEVLGAATDDAAGGTAWFLRRRSNESPELVLRGLAALAAPGSKVWDPAGEAAASKRELTRRSQQAVLALIRRIVQEAEALSAAAADGGGGKGSGASASCGGSPSSSEPPSERLWEHPDVVVVCHYGVIQQLADVHAANCEAVALIFRRARMPSSCTPSSASSFSSSSSWPKESNRCLREARECGWTYSLLRCGKSSTFRARSLTVSGSAGVGVCGEDDDAVRPPPPPLKNSTVKKGQR